MRFRCAGCRGSSRAVAGRWNDVELRRARPRAGRRRGCAGGRSRAGGRGCHRTTCSSAPCPRAPQESSVQPERARGPLAGRRRPKPAAGKGERSRSEAHQRSSRRLHPHEDGARWQRCARVRERRVLPHDGHGPCRGDAARRLGRLCGCASGRRGGASTGDRAGHGEAYRLFGSGALSAQAEGLPVVSGVLPRNGRRGWFEVHQRLLCRYHVGG